MRPARYFFVIQLSNSRVPKYHEDELEFDYILKKAKEIFDGEGEAKS